MGGYPADMKAMEKKQKAQRVANDQNRERQSKAFVGNELKQKKKQETFLL